MELIESGPFAGHTKNGYKLIYADPPWKFSNWSVKGEGKGAAKQYDCMDLCDIKDLPVQDLADPTGAWCLMWATFPMLPEALDTMQAWGFKYAAGGAWGKLSKTGAKIAFGTGFIYRSAAELWLLGRVGKPKSNSKSIRNLILAPVREHSRKPDQMIEMIEAQFDGPRIELFCREAREGWDSFGNQVGKFNKGISNETEV